MNNHLSVSIEVNPEQVQAIVEQQLKEITQQKIILMDSERFMDLFSFNKRFFDEHIASDPRVKQFERKRSRKRYWLAQPTIEMVLQIVNEEW